MRILLVTALLLVGCGAPVQQGSSASRAPGSSSSNPDDVRCQDEVPTGTMRHRTVCRDQAERDGEQKNAERWLKTPRSNPGGM